MSGFFSFIFAVTLWVQVPQWSMIGVIVLLIFLMHLGDWYIVRMNDTFGEGFDWETAPWYSVEGLLDIANLHDDVIDSGYQYTVEALNNAKSN